jgi:hypothetical protein
MIIHSRQERTLSRDQRLAAQADWKVQSSLQTVLKFNMGDPALLKTLAGARCYRNRYKSILPTVSANQNLGASWKCSRALMHAACGRKLRGGSTLSADFRYCPQAGFRHCSQCLDLAYGDRVGIMRTMV